MKPVWQTTVEWVNGECVVEEIVASSQSAAKRAARRLATVRRPYNGEPLTVTAIQISSGNVGMCKNY